VLPAPAALHRYLGRDQGFRAAVTVTPSDTLSSVIELLCAAQVHRVHVVNPQRRPIGVVTTMDVLRVLLTSEVTAHTDDGSTSTGAAKEDTGAGAGESKEGDEALGAAGEAVDTDTGTGGRVGGDGGCWRRPMRPLVYGAIRVTLPLLQTHPCAHIVTALCPRHFLAPAHSPVHPRLCALPCAHSPLHTRLCMLPCAHSPGHTPLCTLACAYSLAHTRLGTLACAHSPVHIRLGTLACAHQATVPRAAAAWRPYPAPWSAPCLWASLPWT
jgi:hypothetical protein